MDCSGRSIILGLPPVNEVEVEYGNGYMVFSHSTKFPASFGLDYLYFGYSCGVAGSSVKGYSLCQNFARAALSLSLWPSYVNGLSVSAVF